jgi:hypothetical protein
MKEDFKVSQFRDGSLVLSCGKDGMGTDLVFAAGAMTGDPLLNKQEAIMDFIIRAVKLRPKEERAMSNDLLAYLPALPQRQDSTKEQLADLRLVANRLGMYDAADALRQLFETEGFETLRYGCHCDIENTVSGQPVDCVIDSHDYEDCIYATPGMRKEQCKYWRVCGS